MNDITYRSLQKTLWPTNALVTRISSGSIAYNFFGTSLPEPATRGVPLPLDDARRMVEGFINHYNNVRLHSAIGYIAPVDKLNGRDQEIFKERDQKLEKARALRKKNDFVATGQSAQWEITRLPIPL